MTRKVSGKPRASGGYLAKSWKTPTISQRTRGLLVLA
jgi:hypothetical protein